MAKKKKSGSSKRGRSSGGDSLGWSEDTHINRKLKQQKKIGNGGKSPNDKQLERERRSALLTRDSKEKHEAGKLKLHITRVQRQIEALRKRLESWDDVEEARLAKEEQRRVEAEQKQRDDERAGITKPRRGRLGPETWKLKGPARPAWQVYDFDTRYVDPYMKDHEEAKKKAARSRNIMVLCKGRFGEEPEVVMGEDKTSRQGKNRGSDVPQPQCREFLSLLMQLGNLAMQSQQLKTARAAFLEAMELDSVDNPITPARCQLMRMYVDNNRPESARRLWERLPSTDASVWIRYSAALIEFVSWRILQEEGSTQETAELRLLQAIKANVFCAYYIAFHDTFQQVMDYTDEVEDADETSPVMEAIEYCNSEQFGAWAGTDGAMDWIKIIILRVLNGESITIGDFTLLPGDVDWRKQLSLVRESEVHPPTDSQTEATAHNSEDSDRESDVESFVDVTMYTGMFETGMEMLESAGALRMPHNN